MLSGGLNRVIVFNSTVINRVAFVTANDRISWSYATSTRLLPLLLRQARLCS
jgi:hypothetical protein